MKGGFKGGWKGGWQMKGGGKGGGKAGKGMGYQGECWRCGQIGHKSNECGVFMVNEAAAMEEGGAVVDAVNIEEKTWVVGAVEEVPEAVVERRRPQKVGVGTTWPKKVNLGMMYGCRNPKGCIDECCSDEGGKADAQNLGRLYAPESRGRQQVRSIGN